MNGMIKKTIILLLLTLLVASCSKKKETVHSVYYWETSLNIDSAERAFLTAHNVKRVYCRYFDVVMDDNGNPQPNATLSFDSKIPDSIEVVPVVYILNDCMKKANDKLVLEILTRIEQMNETNNIHNVNEIQIDCDWTRSTREDFFNFLRGMRKYCHDQCWSLSATIRLHQLDEEAPPVDRGVLMVYNTGNPADISKEKPILDIRDVAPYMKYLKDYKLPLSAAYPLYQWKILFRGKKFKEIIHDDDDIHVFAGDTIITREPSLDDILSAEQAVEKARSDVNNEVILYHLSNSNIKRFKSSDYERIYEVR